MCSLFLSAVVEVRVRIYGHVGVTVILGSNSVFYTKSVLGVVIPWTTGGAALRRKIQPRDYHDNDFGDLVLAPENAGVQV